jgi:integrase
MLADKISTPAAANHWLRLIKALMVFAVEEGWRKDNPTTGVKRVKSRTDGFHTWTEAEIAQFEATHPVGTKARLALALLLYAAQRRSDVVGIGRQHIRDGVLHLRQKKTGAALAIPVHQELARIIAAAPSGNLTLLTTSFRKPFTAAGFGNWFRDQCNEAGLPAQCAAHGLRKAACRRLAEAGCSANVIASISGHRTLTEVSRYTKAADQERMARGRHGSHNPNENWQRRWRRCQIGQKHMIFQGYRMTVAGATGLEPAASAVTGRNNILFHCLHTPSKR